MRVLFMGTPAFSESVLSALVDAGHEVVAAYSQPPRRAGRGKKDRKSPVHERAEALGIPVETPVNFKDPETVETLRAYKADVAVVVAYGLLLPQCVLDAPVMGCLNIHASLLPRWRGAAPIQRAIEAGDVESGVCIMQMDAGLDTGPIVSRETISIKETTTYAVLHDELMALGSQEIVDVLSAGEWRAEPQPSEGVTYAHKIDKAEAQIDWTESATKIARKIRAFSPFPGAYLVRNGERLKILMAVAESADKIHEAGTVVDDAFGIACGSTGGITAGSGVLRVSKIQPAGKGAMEPKAYLNGKPFQIGDSVA